jgi:hypothetical protein
MGEFCWSCDKSGLMRQARLAETRQNATEYAKENKIGVEIFEEANDTFTFFEEGDTRGEGREPVDRISKYS